MATLSVIIPTLNEAPNLPILLRALAAQTRPPDEIIVADAGSTDGTVEAALRQGATVVPGGMPGPGRNAGARAATGDLFLFLDADVVPPPDFVEKLITEFEQSGYGVATTLMEPLSDNLGERILVEAGNLYLQVIQSISPEAPGFCIIVRRKIHEAIGGFDEAAVLAEDFDYVRRAAKHGEFGVLTTVRIPFSLRRVEEDGFFQVAFKYVWCEMYALAGKTVYSVPFEYKFGAHLAPDAEIEAAARRIIDIGLLRENLGRFENPILRLSQTGLERLEHFVQLEWLETTRERFRLQLDPPDLDILNRYFVKRLALIRQTGRPLRATLAKLPTLPVKESLRLLDYKWWASLRKAKNAGTPENTEENRDATKP
jgi:glycosyltransferase involved in cell wall biosynthesis